MPIKKNGPGCCKCQPSGTCKNPVTVAFGVDRCFYPGQPVDNPRVTVSGPGGDQTFDLTYHGYQPVFQGSITVPLLGTYGYTITSPSSFPHTGTFVVANCNGTTVRATIVSNVIRWSLPGCYGAYMPNGLIQGGSISVNFTSGASGGGTTGSDGYAYIRLSGPEPQAGETMNAVASAPLYWPQYKPGNQADQPAMGGYPFSPVSFCDNLTYMHPVDCYGCFVNAGNYQAPQNYSQVTPYLVDSDPGCGTVPQPETGTFRTPWGSACIGSWNGAGGTTAPGPLGYFLGNASGTGFSYALDANGNDITCNQKPHAISFPVYVAYHSPNTFLLTFAARKRCDPTNLHDKCTYPVADDPMTNSANLASVTVNVVHRAGTCSPAILDGTYRSDLYQCTVDANGNSQGTAYDFLAGASFSWTLDNCGCQSSYSSNTDATARAQPAMAPFRGPALGDSPTLRVGIVCPWLLQGGAETWQATLARGLSGLLGDLISWQGAACINSGDPAMIADLSAVMPVAFGWESARELAGRCDVIITWHVADYGDLYGGIPVPPRTLFACHLPTAWGSGTEALLSTVDRLVAVSPSAQARIAPSLLPRSVVIENAVDEARMTATRTRDQVRDSWGVPRTAKVVGFLGRLSSEKDPDAAFALAEEWPEGHVVVIGDGPLRSAMTIGAPTNLHVVGPDADKGVLLAFDALMVPSMWESFGLSMAEAMWMGVPVISTPVGIARQHPSLTRSVPIGAGGGDWADAVRADLADSTGTAKRVADARSFVRSHYTMDRFSRAYASVLADLAPAVVGDRIRSSLLPSVGRMAANFARAAFGQAMAGNPEASPAEQAARKRTCEACPLWDRSADRCVECGCQLPVKRRWATSRCPIGKWEAEAAPLAA